MLVESVSARYRPFEPDLAKASVGNTWKSTCVSKRSGLPGRFYLFLFRMDSGPRAHNVRKGEGTTMIKKLSVFLVVLITLFVAGCGNRSMEEESDTRGNEDEKLQDVTVVLDWTPNTNHTGLYVANEQGFFTEEGLQVEILLPGETTPEQLVAAGQAEFGVSYQETVTHARTQDVPIVSIAAIIQHNTSGFASLKEKGIETPKDFEGKVYGGWGSPVEEAVMDTIMRIDGGDVKEVDIINIGSTDFFTAVERGDIDFAWIYYGWTGVEAELRNIPLNMIYVNDYSDALDYYTPIFITSEEMIADEPETIKKFLRAVSKGYQFAIENPQEAAEILIAAVPELDPELVKRSQEWLASKYQDEAPRWGEQKLEVWKKYADWMYEHDLLEKELDSEQAFTNEFLPENE